MGSPATAFSPVSFFHVLPPSAVLNKPPPRPLRATIGPYWSGPGQSLRGAEESRRTRRAGVPTGRRASRSGRTGSIRSSRAPVLSSTYSTLSHVLPPSVVLKTPRSSLAPHTRPKAATYTVFGSFGWTTILPMLKRLLQADVSSTSCRRRYSYKRRRRRRPSCAGCSHRCRHTRRWDRSGATRDVADRNGRLFLEHEIEGGPVVGGLEQPAGRRRDVVRGRIALHNRDGG